VLVGPHVADWPDVAQAWFRDNRIQSFKIWPARGGQNFPGGRGKNILFALKMPQNILFSFKKVKKHTILACQGGARDPSCPPLRTPMKIYQI